MSLESFEQLYQRAAERKGGPRALNFLLGEYEPDQRLTLLGDDRFLAEFTKKVFQSGFVWHP